MKTNDKLDRFTAKKCGIIFNETAEGLMVLVIPKELNFDGKIWTVKDANCREAIRERLEISTNRGHYHGDKKWDHWYSTTEDNIEADGESIKEAEIGCITAMMEADNG